MKKSFLMAAVLVVLMVFSASVCAAANDAAKGGDSENDIDYVGKDLELKEGEMGIVSVGDGIDYVGKDMDLKEGEAGIISIGEGQDEEPAADVKPYVAGGGVLLLAAAGGLVLKIKKNQ